MRLMPPQLGRSSQPLSQPATTSSQATNVTKSAGASRPMDGGYPSGAPLRPAHRHRQRLRADEALEAADDGPDRAQAHRAAAVDGLDAGLADERRAAVVAGDDAVGEEDADGARLRPGGVLVGGADAGVVAGERPD